MKHLSKWELRRELAHWIQKNYGKRCDAFQSGCGNCDAWFCYDNLFQIGMWNSHRMKVIKPRKRFSW
jgi:hypothetical protein